MALMGIRPAQPGHQLFSSASQLGQVGNPLCIHDKRRCAIPSSFFVELVMHHRVRFRREGQHTPVGGRTAGVREVA